MTRNSKIAWGTVAAAVMLVVTVMVYLRTAPVNLTSLSQSAGYRSAVECALKQKDLYGWVESYREKHGRLPDSVGALLEDDPRAMYCSGTDGVGPFALHPENYGNPNAVLISESGNGHPFSLRLWLMGASPRVHTMGDGRVYPFAHGKIVSLSPDSPKKK